jgi:hypothetical protein
MLTVVIELPFGIFSLFDLHAHHLVLIVRLVLGCRLQVILELLVGEELALPLQTEVVDGRVDELRVLEETLIGSDHRKYILFLF